MAGDLGERKHAYGEIGYYYQCCAPASLYKYYSDSQLHLNSIRILSGGGLPHGRWILLWRTMISQEKQWFRSVLLPHPESVTAALCWRIWQVPGTGRKVWDSGPVLTKRMFRTGWADWDCYSWLAAAGIVWWSEEWEYPNRCFSPWSPSFWHRRTTVALLV